MTDAPEHETVDVTDLVPPPPIPEALQLALVAMEIKRIRENYEADNPKEEEENAE